MPAIRTVQGTEVGGDTAVVPELAPVIDAPESLAPPTPAPTTPQ